MKNSTHKIAILPGDGIGPEVVAEAIKVLKAVEKISPARFDLHTALVGGVAFDAHKTPLPNETLALAKNSDAILLGAVGGTKWEGLDYAVRPERALLALRSELNLFANLRPAKVFPELLDASPLKSEVVRDTDFLVVRELTGGLYFGTPRGVSKKDGERVGVNTLTYTESEIRRIARLAFEAAQKRGKRLCSVDKANVLETTELWRAVVTELHTTYPDVTLTHMYVDNAAMQIVRNPRQFDVIVTENMFGDILSDVAAMITGSIGMLASASLNDSNKGLYEPIHGSAPDIAGKSLANPIATILSLALMFTHSLNLKTEAEKIETAVAKTLAQGLRTSDIADKKQKPISTQAMGDAIVKTLLTL
jgi:3-isopropylmalate dehydrogenase